jgi:hypothetical protein
MDFPANLDVYDFEGRNSSLFTETPSPDRSRSGGFWNGGCGGLG